MFKKTKKAQVIIIVMVFIFVATLIAATTMTVVSNYNHSVTNRIEDLRTEVYK